MWQRFARFLLKAGGWTLEGELPAVDKAVFIGAPHTSNWDGFWFMAYKVYLDVDMNYLAKHTLFWWPLGPVLRSLGAMPVDRAVSADMVRQIVDEFAQRDRFWFALSPEGTRRWQPYWKTGFYRIASLANVPIVLVFIDYGSRRIGIGPTLPVTHDAEAILGNIREFYAPFVGRIPARQGPVAFAPPSSQAEKCEDPRGVQKRHCDN